MKYLIIIVLLSPLGILAQQKGFVINGTVSGLPDQSTVTLTDVNNPTDTLARATVKQGAFVLKGMIKEPNLHQLNFAGPQKKSVIFIGNDNVIVKGSVENIQQLDVKGSAVQNDFVAFQATFNPLFQRLTQLNQQINATSNIQPTDTLMLAYKDQFEKIKNAIDQFVANKKTSPVTPFLMVVTGELEQDMQRQEMRFSQLSPEVQQGFYGKILKSQIDASKIGAIGTEAIGFTQNDAEGKPVSLSSFRGKYVLVDFWASWCRPCRMENPNVVSAYNKFKGKNFTVLGVSLDRDRDPWLQAIKDDQLTWTHVSDLKFWNNEVAQKYNITSIPQNFLIDPQGKIIGKNLRGEELQSKLCQLLGCN